MLSLAGNRNVLWLWRHAQQAGKHAERQLRPRGAAGQHSSPHPLPLSPFSFILSHPSLKEPDFLVVMVCRRNKSRYHVPVSFIYTISFISVTCRKLLSSPPSLRLPRVFLLLCSQAYFMSESVLIECFCFFFSLCLARLCASWGWGNVSLLKYCYLA